jgi:hypothetical protein
MSFECKRSKKYHIQNVLVSLYKIGKILAIFAIIW